MSHSLTSKDLGSLTAYGDAINGGYNGTRESFYASLFSQNEFTLPVNPSVKPDECTMFIYDVQGDRESVTIPSYSGSDIVYDGESHTVTFEDIDTELMNVSGTFTATNAGTYYAEFTLKDTSSYKWSDGGIWKERIPWTIEKMAGVLTLSNNNVVVTDESTTKTITFTASNTVTIEVLDNTLATASISGNTITVTVVTGAVGDTKMIVTCAESENQAGVVKEVGIYANYAPVYGATWDGTYTPTWTRTDSASLMVDPVPYVDDGETVPSSPFDEIMPWAGMVEVEDDNAGTLVTIPKYYYSCTKDGTAMTLKISPIPFEGSHVSPRHADCGDGYGERDVVYIGKYLCDENYKSTSGVNSLTNKTRAQFRDGIHALGADIWQCDYAMYWTLRFLFLAEISSWDYYNKIGNSYNTPWANGMTDSIPYHTGTTGATRASAGRTKYRNIEIGGRKEIIDGISLSSYIYCQTDPSKFSDTTSQYTRIGSCASKDEGYIRSFLVPSTVSGYEWALLPDNCNATSAAQYACAYWNYYRTRLYPYADISKNRPFFSQYYANTNESSYLGGRLMKLPQG